MITKEDIEKARSNLEYVQDCYDFGQVPFATIERLSDFIDDVERHMVMKERHNES